MAQISTSQLVAAATNAVTISVLAAGGIASGKSMAAAFALGASGVQMGTVYLGSEECSRI